MCDFLSAQDIAYTLPDLPLQFPFIATTIDHIGRGTISYLPPKCPFRRQRKAQGANGGTGGGSITHR